MKKTAVITGAGSGLGAALAQKLSQEGYRICLTGRTENKLDKTAEKLGGDYSVYTLDVRSDKQVNKVFNQIKSDHGQIDLLINNAGLGIFDLAENIDTEATHDMIDINLKGTIFCTQEVIADMKERNEGTNVNIVSTAGVEWKVNESVYCAIKFWVRGFTDSLQLEVQDSNVRIHGMYMGGMNTDFWDGILEESVTSNMMDPDDIADIVLANIKVRPHINVSDVIIKNK